MVSSDIQMRVDENIHIICQIVRVIILLGKQRLTFHVDNEDFCITNNPGNFLALLSVLLRVILLFLITSINQGPRMPLKFSQDLNDIINVIGHDLILVYSSRG